MVFDIKGKVALVTGGASGIGLSYSKELLKNGLRGVTLADVSKTQGHVALEQIEKEFGPNKAIFVQTDVTNYKQFENAFKKTIEEFKNVDILINNAGILNDAIWEKEVAINVNGVINGILLGLETYIPKYKQGKDGVVVNISSTAGIDGSGHVPIYSGTKYAVVGLTLSWGVPFHYKRTSVRVIALSPGVTITPLITEMAGRSLGDAYEEFGKTIEGWPTQEPEDVSKEMVKLIQNAANGTIWLVDGGAPALEIKYPRTPFMQNCGNHNNHNNQNNHVN